MYVPPIEVVKGWCWEELDEQKIVRVEHARSNVNDRLYFEFKPNGGMCPRLHLYKTDRITLGTKPGEEDTNYAKVEYKIWQHDIGKIKCYLF